MRKSQGGSGRDDPTETQLRPGWQVQLPGIALGVVAGPDAGRSTSASRGAVRIGTAADNDLVLTDPAVSRRHCEVRLRQEHVRVIDLGSTNGVEVDGVRVFDAVLTPASLVRLGSTAIRVTPVHEAVLVGLSSADRFGALLGGSVAMRQVFGVLERVAPSEATVLLEGESGTGKELAAEAIHHHSARSEGPFVTVDCGAMPANLIESELFGHARGAFTGAVGERRGLIEEADGGTLFLDEIGELPVDLQPKLLRFLEKGEIRRVGESALRKVDARVVAATHRELAAEVNRGAFREDLYYRLAVVRVQLPPLRARTEDIPMIVEQLVASLAPERVAEAPALASTLGSRPFPGNVRELRNAVERSLALLPARPSATTSAGGAHGTAPVQFGDLEPLLGFTYKEALERLVEQFERRYLEHVLARSGGSVSGAARLAGLSRRYVQKLMLRHGLRRPTDDT
jgi:DNA-binding NtrC family response regulator